MNRKMLIALLAVLGLATWGTTKSFAMDNPGVRLKPQAVMVTRVFPGSTAARQGIEVGDVIVSVNGNAIRSPADLQYRLGQAGPVAELGLIDVRTGWQNQVTVYPQFGRIGVDVQTKSPGNDRPIRPVRPIRPISPPWTPGDRPTIQPVPTPGDRMTIQPVPTPGGFPGR